MTPEDLAREFRLIDSGTNEGGDGVISREELWTFMTSGKLGGEITRSDFDALFKAIDEDGNGTVDFTEFCRFLGRCTEYLGEELDSRTHPGYHDEAGDNEESRDA